MKKVLFYPDPPIQLPGHTLSKTIIYFQMLGYEPTNDINSNWEIGVHWTRMDENKIRCEIPERLLNDKRPVFNRHLCDISKTYVDWVFTKVFGYSSFADTKKMGYCVRKSERQGVHDGKIVRTPCEKEPGFVYQKLIDNRMDIDLLYDIRLPIIGGDMPCVYIKSKRITGTFEHTLSPYKKGWAVPVSEYLSSTEQRKVLEFCSLTGFDLGELDALRDNSTGKLYIIDMNHTPGGTTITSWPGSGKELAKRATKLLEQKIYEYTTISV